MKSFGAILLVCITLCFVQGFPGGDKEGGSCAGGSLTISDTFKSASEACWKKNKPADGADIKNTKSCSIVCLGQSLGWLDTAGKPVNANVTAALKEIFPTAVLSDATTEMTSCITANEKSLVLKDGDCSSYNDLIECGMKGFKKVCMP